MNPPLYFSRLAPFRETFATGKPVLTYHHVARPRRGARLRGLYVPLKLFTRQMIELKEGGFFAPSYNQLSFARPERPSVFITFDDGFVDVMENALPVLKSHGVVAIQFLVSSLIGKTNEWQQKEGDVEEKLMDDSQVRDWLAASQEIGAHSRTHPRLSHLTTPEAREEIVSSKKFLEDRFGRPIHHFCYPYGDYNRQVRDLVEEAGYLTACTTQPGVHRTGDDLFAIKRITARYPSRNLKQIWQRWFRTVPF